MERRNERALIRSVHRTVANHFAALVDAGGYLHLPKTMIVACSGGQDSLCLLYALHAATHAMPNIALHVAYYDHGSRPREETEADAVAVHAHAAELGLSFHMGSARGVGAGRRMHHVSEAKAREQRYAYLGGLAASIGADYVATGHTATDQAETVLLRLIRGTGIAGLAAMRERSPWPLGPGGPTVLRPLLTIERATTDAYCRARGLQPRHDQTNDDRHYTRNRVRLDLMPRLSTLNPRIVTALAALASDAGDVARMIDHAVDACEERVSVVDGRVHIDAELLESLAPPVQGALLTRMLVRAGVPVGQITRLHLRELQERPATGERRVDLPGNYRASVSRSGISVALAQQTESDGHCGGGLGVWTLMSPGITRLDGWLVQVDPPALPVSLDAGLLSAWFAPSALRPPLIVRSRQPGDRIAPFGMSGTKKIQDLLVDVKVPVSVRDTVPLLDVNGAIAWVVGFRTARWCAARPGEEAVRIAFTPTDDRRV